MDWIAHFSDFFSRHSKPLEAILDAAGCREAWVQGQMFLDRGELQIKTNATRDKLDLRCADPPMIAEIKVCGGDYAAKMQAWIEADVDKLARVDGAYERYMILIVDNRNLRTRLGKWLTTCDFPHIRKDEQMLPPAVLIRIWQIPKDADCSGPGSGRPQSTWRAPSIR